MIFIHKKSGKKYEILHFGVEEKSATPVVIYKSETGTIWTRPASEFFDGRFEQWKDEFQLRVSEGLAAAYNYAFNLPILYRCRTGGALGIDSAFFDGAKDAGKDPLNILPWRSYHNHGIVVPYNEEAEAIARKHLHSYDWHTPGTKKN